MGSSMGSVSHRESEMGQAVTFVSMLRDVTMLPPVRPHLSLVSACVPAADTRRWAAGGRRVHRRRATRGKDDLPKKAMGSLAAPLSAVPCGGGTPSLVARGRTGSSITYATTGSRPSPQSTYCKITIDEQGQEQQSQKLVDHMPGGLEGGKKTSFLIYIFKVPRYCIMDFSCTTFTPRGLNAKNGESELRYIIDQTAHMHQNY